MTATSAPPPKTATAFSNTRAFGTGAPLHKTRGKRMRLPRVKNTFRSFYLKCDWPVFCCKYPFKPDGSLVW